MDLSFQNRLVAERIKRQITALATTNQFIGGEAVSTFETRFADYCGSSYCVAFNSGTDALRLALIAVDLPPRSEVITSPFSFIATVEAIRQAGLRPCFADVDDETMNLSAESVGRHLRQESSCMVPVHFGGNPCDMECLRAVKRGMIIVEDACQAHGSRIYGKHAGTLGAVGTFSFYPTKNLGAWGDGGAAITDDRQIAKRLRLLGNHGQVDRYFHESQGWNSRLDALQAVVLSTKLEFLDNWNHDRIRLASLYDQLLGNLETVRRVKKYAGAEMVPYLYTIRVAKRDRLREFLNRFEIGTEVVYPHALHLLPASQDLGYKAGDFPTVEKICKEVLSLPLYPGLRESDVYLVCEKIRDFYR
ncbi:MAG: DegT/DnrJ/EryC1/StrS family aminotransferase [Acidobacteria bacterium]|nr:DegT/DnrJ/EryC1/StrS family aminotransferase [Acidobacteriota bacterium]